MPPDSSLGEVLDNISLLDGNSRKKLGDLCENISSTQKLF
jgi:hypothetical protein